MAYIGTTSPIQSDLTYYYTQTLSGAMCARSDSFLGQKLNEYEM